MLKQNKETVKIVFKNLPLKIHDQAQPAALAALAAWKQGKFWEYHDMLFAQKKITPDSFEIIAKKLDLNMEKFRLDVNSDDLKKHLNGDMVEAQQLNITGTPSIFINGRKLKQRSVSGFQQQIDEELKKLE
ncbi:DsbA family protein [Desulfosediminicola flagellatus]|uniref:DsbA family protein n=1 Tax=Desulfosediminicola flagellatus TaxID=2569541 RepID=UPI00142EB478|nr:thioredoxin domain-containing protein [Desulfosediminicola flagellatus]